MAYSLITAAQLQVADRFVAHVFGDVVEVVVDEIETDEDGNLRLTFITPQGRPVTYRTLVDYPVMVIR